MTGAGAYFLQAVVETCQDLRKRNAPSPVIVAFVSEKSPEFSNDSRKQVAAALESAGASLWIVALQDTGSADRSPEAYERAVVLGDVTVFSGGMTRTILSMQSIEQAFDGLATLIAARYLVLYGRPEQTIPPTTDRRHHQTPGRTRAAPALAQVMRSFVATGIGAAILVAGVAASQVYRGGTDVVLLSVTVTDSANHHVAGPGARGFPRARGRGAPGHFTFFQPA